MVEQQPDENGLLRKWASLLCKAAGYARSIGNVGDAEKMSVRAMKMRRQLLGQDHKETLNCITVVGLAYSLRG
jgi:hypothetical protein